MNTGVRLAICYALLSPSFSSSPYIIKHLLNIVIPWEPWFQISIGLASNGTSFRDRLRFKISVIGSYALPGFPGILSTPNFSQRDEASGDLYPLL